MSEKEVIVRRGLVKKHAAVDYEVWQWKTRLEHAKGTQRITKTEIQAFAVEAYKKVGINNFKASDGWYRRWRLRWKQPNVVRHKKVDLKEENDKFNSNNSIHNNLQGTVEDETRKRRTSSNQQQQESEKNRRRNGILSKSIKMSKEILPFERSSFCIDISETNKTSLKFKNNLEVERDDSEFPNILGLVRVQNLNFTQCKSLETNSEPLETAAETGIPINSLKNNSDLVIHDQRQNPYKSENEENKMHKNTFSGMTSFPGPQGTETMVFEVKNTGQEFDNSTDNRKASENKEDVDENETLRIMDSMSKVQDDADSSPLEEIIISTQSDSRISLPSINTNPEASYSLLFDQNNLDFEDHELFCDSCEDFHPRHKGLFTSCYKQEKGIVGNSLLSCVFEKKVIDTSMKPSPVKSDEDAEENISNVEVEDKVRLKNIDVVMPKGKRYLVQFKSKVVNYALSHNVKQAVDKFKVNRGTVSEWIAEQNRMCCNASQKPFKMESTSLTDDSQFLSWLESSKFNLTNELIRQKASEWLSNKSANNKKCQWLHIYAHRLNGTEDINIKKRYIAYPAAFKRVAVFHAQTHSNIAAARVFGVARRRIVEWQQSSGGDAKEKVKCDIANNVTDEAVDKQVFHWFMSQDTCPSSKQVRCKAVEMYRSAGYHSIQCSTQWYYRWRARHKLLPPRSQLCNNDAQLLAWALTQLDSNQCVTHRALAAQAATFGYSKVSRGWTYRFCRKYYKLLQDVPDPNTPLPPVLELQVKSFRQALQEAVTTTTNILAMDEVPLYFLPKDQGKKPPLVHRPGFESCQASLVVSCLADGTLLPSMFIFKNVKLSCESDPRVIIAATETGLMTLEVMEQWIDLVCVKNICNDGGILITDCFNIHTKAEVKLTLAKHHIHQAVIPGGCAFKLLPTTRICRMFKTMLEDMCHMSLASQTTALQSPSPEQLYLWAVRVHKHLAKHQKENIKTAFKEMLFQQCTIRS